MKEATVFGLSLYGDRATIKEVRMINNMGRGVCNPFAMVYIFDCIDHCSVVEKGCPTHCRSRLASS